MTDCDFWQSIDLLSYQRLCPKTVAQDCKKLNFIAGLIPGHKPYEGLDTKMDLLTDCEL
jgi:hypothetical protein